MRQTITNYIRENTIAAAIIIYIVIFTILNMGQVSWLYMPNGNIREFGIGYKNKTIFPLWIVSIVLGIGIYIGLMYVKLD